MNDQTANRTQQTAMVAVNIGLLLIMAGACMPLVRLFARQACPTLTWLYAVGALLCLAGRIVTVRREMPTRRAKRLIRLELWAAVIFCAGAFFLFWPGAGATDWLAFTLAGGMIQGYVSMMLPRAMRG